MDKEHFIECHKRYTKINTIWKRDERGKIVQGAFSTPELEYLEHNLGIVEEKIDGTNICIFWDTKTKTKYFYGKTENAEIPRNLIIKLEELFPDELLEKVITIDLDEEGNEIHKEVRLYGEGYGKGIQKGANYISKDCGFILFDVRIGHWWLRREDVYNLAEQLNIPHVPYLGIMTMKEAEEMVKKTFTSQIAENKDYIAEGVIWRPLVDLFGRSERVLCKIKVKDYAKG